MSKKIRDKNNSHKNVIPGCRTCRGGLYRYFEDIEVCKTLDLDHFYDFEGDALEMLEGIEGLGLRVKAEALRIRKMGHRKSVGYYYPVEKEVCIDPMYLETFAHEIGHHLDFSAKEDYGKYLHEHELFSHVLKTNVSSIATGDVKENETMEYLTEGKEVFARMFEVFCLYMWPDLIQVHGGPKSRSIYNHLPGQLLTMFLHISKERKKR